MKTTETWLRITELEVPGSTATTDCNIFCIRCPNPEFQSATDREGGREENDTIKLEIRGGIHKTTETPALTTEMD